MRMLLALSTVLALLMTIAACDHDEGRPDETPRTVPPASVPSSGAPRPLIRGVGPIYET